MIAFMDIEKVWGWLRVRTKLDLRVGEGGGGEFLPFSFLTPLLFLPFVS
jgi:hypothetical protein